MLKKYMCVLLLVSLLVLPVAGFAAGPPQGMPFSDVSKDFWAHEAIRTMAEKQVIAGYTDGTFKPNQLVSRAEFAAIMVKALNLSMAGEGAATFADVPAGYWGYAFIEAAKNYLTGYRTDAGLLFRPNVPTVREDVVVALVKALGLELTDTSVLAQYADYASISENLKPYVATAIEHGLIHGYEKGSAKYINPLGKVTRAEAAQLLLNIILGNTGHWEEKIVIGDDDIEAPDTPVTPAIDLKLTVTEKAGHLKLQWSKVNPEKFKYYKVVASRNDSTPQYPQNGYVDFIENPNSTQFTVTAGDGYTDGDFSKFGARTRYYFAITAVYSDGTKVTSNVVHAEVPEVNAPEQGTTTPATGDAEDVSEDIPKLTAKASGKGFTFSWNPSTAKTFRGYKLVFSKSDADPTYPDNGYYVYITDRSLTTAEVKRGDWYTKGDFKQFEAGRYYVRIVTLYDTDKKNHSEVLRVTF